jgi:biopolymer transport protein ExbD
MEHQELNLTPYLDILMNLIVFVMLSGVAAYGEIPVDAPHNVDHATPSVVHTLRVGRSGFAIDGEAVPVDGLRARLAGLSPRSRKLMLSAERDVELQDLVAAMDVARLEHFDEITLSDFDEIAHKD